MADFAAAATLDQLAPGHGMTVTVRSVPVALFNVEGTIYAIDDTCRHAGVSLGAGELRRPYGPVSRPRLAVRCHYRPHDA
jgi:nitrite reductase/ring-hydroxylating ferredoxin subunit